MHPLKLRDTQTGQVHLVSSARTVLGRDAGADIVVSGTRVGVVSAMHAEVRPSGNQWQVADLGSTNGTFVNGVRLTAPQTLKDQDIIALAGNGPSFAVMLPVAGATILEGAADFEATVLIGDKGQQHTVSDAAAPPRAQAPDQDLVVLQRVPGGEEIRAQGPVIVLGREPGCSIPLRTDLDRTVSSRHAEIRFEEGGTAVIADLGSTNGTWLGRHRVTKPQPLRAGDQIALGNQGPTFDVLRVGAQTAQARPPQRKPSPRPSLAAMVVSAKQAAQGGGTALFAAALADQFRSKAARRLRWTIFGSLAGVLVVAGGIYFLAAQRIERARREAQASRAELVVQLGRAARLRDSSNAEIVRLTQQIEAARNSASGSRMADSLARIVVKLRGQSAAFQSSMSALRGLDLAGIVASNRAGVAAVWNGVLAASGFFVTNDGFLITSRRVIQKDSMQGDLPLLVFPGGGGSAVALKGDVVRTGEGPDSGIVLIKVGGYNGGRLERINWLASTIRPQLPVVALGFRRGAVTDSEPTPTWIPAATTGMIVDVDTARITVLAFGALAMDGAPVLDGSGALIGIATGILAESPVRMTVVFPRAIRRLLPADARARLGLAP